MSRLSVSNKTGTTRRRLGVGVAVATLATGLAIVGPPSVATTAGTRAATGDAARDRKLSDHLPADGTTESPPAPTLRELWAARSDGSGVDSDVAHAIAVSPNGTTTYITGRNGGDGTLTDYVTMAYDTGSGRELWAARYDGPAKKTDEAWDLGVSPDGSRVFVSGASATGSFSSDADYATVAYDARTGDRLWVARYNGPGDNEDVARALDVSPDGDTVLITGGSQSDSRFTSTDYTTIAYDAATGVRRWIARYNGPSNNRDSAQALALSPDGHTAFVTGTSPTSGFLTDDYATVAYEVATGNQRWVARYDGPSKATDGAEALAVSPDGSHVFVTGGSAGRDGGQDYATVAYDAGSGTEAWVSRYDGPTSGHDTANDLAISPDGSRVFVTGSSSGDYGTVSYASATGDELWAARYDGPVGGPDQAAALVVSPDGSHAYVTGNSVGVSYDIATVAYRADSGADLGADHWRSRYNGPGNDGDAGTALVMTPDGNRLLVTGQSVGNGTGADYLTLAYGAAPPEIRDQPRD